MMISGGNMGNGNSPRNKRDLIEDADKNPDNWEVVEENRQPSTKKGNKGRNKY